MNIAKVTNQEEFQKVLNAYKDLVPDPKASVSHKNELKTKMQNFIRKELISLNMKQQKEKKGNLEKLLEFLLLLDRELPYEDFFSQHGDELYGVIFKLTFYDHDYAVNNNRAFPLNQSSQEESKGEEEEELLKLVILEHSQLLAHLEQNVTYFEGKCNFVVNNLLNKILSSHNKQDLLRAVAEALYGQDANFSTRRTAKLLVNFGTLFKTVTSKCSSFLMGSLFALGGLLKLEAKSYLKTINEWRDDFRFACPLINSESELEKQEEQKLRVMDDADVHYFETDFISVVLEFIHSIVAKVKGGLREGLFSFYVDFSQPKFIDELDEVKEKEAEKLEGVESMHYVLCFLFDMLQFSFQYMVRGKEMEVKGEEVKGPRDHREALGKEELPIFDFEYYFPRFEEIILLILTSLKQINVGDPYRYLWFWHMKNSEEEKKWDDDDEGKDCYDRTDNYNIFGLSAYLFLSFKATTAHLISPKVALSPATQKLIQASPSALCPLSPHFLFDSIVPFVSYCLRSKSSTLKQMAVEAAALWAFLLQGKQQFERLGQFTRDESAIQFVVQYLYNFLGQEEASRQLQFVGMKTVFQMLGMYAAEPRLRIFQYLYQILDDDKNDRGIGLLTSQFFKPYCDRDPAVFFVGSKEIIKETLDQQKDENAYILDYTERIGASLNLYIYLHQKESQWLQSQKEQLVAWWGEGSPQQVTDPNFKKELKEKYLEPLVHIIEGGFATIEQDETSLNSSAAQEEAVKLQMREQINAKRNHLGLLKFNLQEALAL